MTDSVPSIDVGKARRDRPAPPGRREDRLSPKPEVPPTVVDLVDDMDPSYVEFFAAALPQAVAVARRITGDLAAAEDAAAEALARAYLRWAKLRSLPYRQAWVLRVAANEAIGTVRKQARRDRILRRQPPTPPVETDRQARLPQVVDQIGRLPRRQREVVVLRFYADLSIDEVATALDISPGSVKSHLHRAVRTLRERFGADILEGTLE
jgi:RNA polymerase sigma factor (sigma-70 family)